ncbi:MAG TPA: peptidase MA family metallohydrolase [Terriglobales bacterium]|nr:peptidase MA family metallohydrolase [Terriglobales bacterium]
MVRSTDSIERLQRMAQMTLPNGATLVRQLPIPAPRRRQFEIASQPLTGEHAPWAAEASGNVSASYAPASREPVAAEVEISEEESPPVSPETAQLAAAAIDAVAAGDHATAVDLLRQALLDAPHHPLLKRNLQMTLLNWATAELNADQPENALVHLEQADALGNHHAVLRALGAAYLRIGRHADAANVLETAVDLAPSDGQSLFFLSQALTELDRRAEALDLLMRAQEAGMRGAVVDRLAARLSREVDTEWDYIRSASPHFDIDYHEGTDADVVYDVAAALEDAYTFVGARLDHYPERRTRAVLYPQEDFHHTTQMPDWVSGLFDGRIKVPIGGLRHGDNELSRVIRHEYAHRVIVDVAGHSCPVWLNEGISMWAEGSADFRERWALQELAGRRLLDIASITGPLATLGEERAKIAYAQSYLAVAHLAERYGDQRIAELLAELGRTRDLQEASRLVFRTDLQAVLATYFDRLAE